MLQVILPYLKESFEKDDEEEDKNVLVSILDLLCNLVKEQPTAMALIREQRAWSAVKRFGSCAGELSNVCQQIIKTLILNSHKFKKIRLSEAEAMALQDDENDRINFDERKYIQTNNCSFYYKHIWKFLAVRNSPTTIDVCIEYKVCRDRNAQYWLFKQLYHVLVQSSNQVLVAGWPAAIHHLTTAWQVTLDLVRRVPEFFLFAVERGITDINVRLTESLLSENNLAFFKDFADLLGALLNFQVYVIVNFDLMNEEILHVNINQTKETLTEVVFSKVRTILQSKGNLKFCRVLLSSVLESSYVTELLEEDGERQQSSSPDCEESGYEADDSESTELSGGSTRRAAAYRVTFPSSFHFFIDCFLQLFEMYAGEPEFIYTIEYLLFKLVNNCGKARHNAKLFNEQNGLTRLYCALDSLLGTGLR